MDYYEIIKKLIGPINPVGETREDEKRLENLEYLIGVIELFVEDIEEVAKHRNRVEYSMKKAGERAYKFRNTLTGYED